MNGKIFDLALAVFFTGMGVYGATPMYFLAAIYFYCFFTYDLRKRQKEEDMKIRSDKYLKEIREKERIRKITKNTKKTI